ncbi:MAG: DUF4199 domain-containing protein [Cyclobacteriaceae bacterium]|jgi:hypothetical protein
MESEAPSVTTRSTGIRFGLISAVIGITLMVVFSMAKIDSSGPVGYASYLIYAALVFLAHKHFKENGDGFMSIGQGIGIGFWIGLISGLISGPFTFIYLKFVDSGMIDMAIEKQREGMLEGGMDEAAIDQAMEMSSAFMGPGMFAVFAFIGSIIVYTIIAILVSLFTQKKNPEMSI